MTNTHKLDVKRYLQRLAVSWSVILVVLVIGASTAFGFNPITGEIDFFSGVGMLGNLFGGLASFAALVGVVLLLGAVALGLFYMTKKDYTGKTGLQNLHIALGLLVVIGASYIGGSWISLPSGAGLVSLLLLGLITGSAVVVTSRPMKRVMAPARTQQFATDDSFNGTLNQPAQTNLA